MTSSLHAKAERHISKTCRRPRCTASTLVILRSRTLWNRSRRTSIASMTKRWCRLPRHRPREKPDNHGGIDISGSINLVSVNCGLPRQVLWRGNRKSYILRPAPSRFVCSPADREPSDVNDLEPSFVEDAHLVGLLKTFQNSVHIGSSLPHNSFVFRSATSSTCVPDVITASGVMDRIKNATHDLRQSCRILPIEEPKARFDKN